MLNLLKVTDIAVLLLPQALDGAPLLRQRVMGCKWHGRAYHMLVMDQVR